MITDLIKYLWKKHKRIAIVFTSFLVILAFIIPFQNIITEGPKILSYYDYNQTNKVDYINDYDFNPATYNLTLNDYNTNFNMGMSVKNTEHYASLAFIAFNKLNITFTNLNNRKETLLINRTITIVGISNDQLIQLKNLNLVNTNYSFIDSDALVSSNFFNYLNNTNSLRLNLSGNNSIITNSPKNFIWYTNKYLTNFPLSSFGSGDQTYNIYPLSIFDYSIFLPINEFINKFAGQILYLRSFISVNREKLFSLDQFLSYNPISPQLLNGQYEQVPFHTIGASEWDVTEQFFQQSFYQSNNLGTVTFLIIAVPTLIIAIFLTTGLISQWEDEFLQNWLYFKHKGLKFSTFMRAYIFFGILLSLLSSVVTFLLYNIIRYVLYKILFNYTIFDLFSNAVNILGADFVFLAIVCLYSFYKTISKLDQKSWKEIQGKPFFKIQINFYHELFVVSAMAVLLAIVLKVIPNLQNTINESVILSFWITVLGVFIYVMAPFGLIIGGAGLISQNFDTIEKKILNLLPFIKLPNLRALHLSETKRLAFIFILMLSIQTFFALYIINYPYYTNEVQYNETGADYSVLFTGNYTAQEISNFNKEVLDTGLVTSSFVSYQFTPLGYSSNTTSAIKVFQIENASKLPSAYKISNVDRSILKNALTEQKGIILSNGISYKKQNMQLIMNNYTEKINLMTQTIELPGFNSNLDIILLVLPSSIKITSENIPKEEKIFYFSNGEPNQKTFDKITSIANNYQDIIIGDFFNSKYITINFGGYLTDGYSSPLSTENILITVTLLFLLFISLIGYIFLIIVSLNNKKKTFGILLSKGLSKRKLKFSILMDNFFLLLICVFVSFCLSYLAIFDLFLIIFPSLNFQFPIVQLSFFIGELILLGFIFLISYVILSITVRKQNIIDYLEHPL